jgi:hypothetical protein
VPYHRLFSSSQNPAEAIIGGSPLVVHTIVVALGLILLQRPWMTKNKWVFHILYWLVIVNFMELIGYIGMSSFAAGGDTGHFNHGLGLSPWILFVAGTLAIVVGLYVLSSKILPLMDDVMARENHLTHWAILLMTALLCFYGGVDLSPCPYTRTPSGCSASWELQHSESFC